MDIASVWHLGLSLGLHAGQLTLVHGEFHGTSMAKKAARQCPAPSLLCEAVKA